MDAKNMIIELGNVLSREKDLSYDLWTCLPSSKIAEKYHGDYYGEFTPSINDILIEANYYIRFLVTGDETYLKAFNETCPCGENHDEEKEVLTAYENPTKSKEIG